MNKHLTHIFALLLLVLATACQPKNKIQLEHVFENNSWKAFDKIELTTAVNDSENPYQIKFYVDLSENFTPNEFSFGLSQKNDDGESVYSHHVIPVRNVAGEMDAEFVDGFYRYSLLINKAVFFNSLANYHFSIENTMNKFRMEGVQRIELEITQR